MDRQSIVHAALELLDEAGLDGLTVRRLATRLGVRSPALYWHVRNKQELLDEMAQELQARQDLGPPRAGEPWREWLTRRARERRRILLSRRDGARLVAATRPTAAAVNGFDAELAALVDRGFTPVRAMRAIVLLGHYITGFVLEEQADQQRHADTGETPPERMTEDQRTDLLRATPTLAAAIRDGGDPGGEAAFEDGLRMLIDGIAAGLERSRNDDRQT
ncbi:TetR/AcrR family tetracycline transcriptional repressor [Lipingzhangella halophila]|uniref:TetR/AcrR family tetracycline transcriptional repressor n=1 Tax=Lipingzhangella halophila TaxID=1783352 RepID=A0A7W7RP27_9ACTN|nr:TetR/AcrR family transcriptional regulator C-terminal domain-containing protein [Lipingzhangella halophila]MBB4935539.1 TetR/AcrR family tetracycline transcriptional repressor [Lipingzhangella halophila]